MWLFRRKHNVYIVQDNDHLAVLGVFSNANEAISYASYTELTAHPMNALCLVTEWEIGGAGTRLERRLAVAELPEQYMAKIEEHERERRGHENDREVAMTMLADSVRARYNALLDRYDKAVDPTKGEHVHNDAQASFYAHGEKLLSESPENQDGYGFQLDDLWRAQLLQELN